MDWRERITIDPETMGGKPVVRGTRVPVQVIIGSLAGGMAVDEICREYRVAQEDIQAALAYAAEVLADERVHAPDNCVSPGRSRSRRLP